jgi:hypothetical protein
MFNPFNLLGFHSGGYIGSDPLKQKDELQKIAKIKFQQLMSDLFNEAIIKAQFQHSTEIFYRNLRNFAEEHRN